MRSPREGPASWESPGRDSTRSARKKAATAATPASAMSSGPRSPRSSPSPVRGEAAAAWRRVIELKEVLDANRRRVSALEGDLSRTTTQLHTSAAVGQAVATEADTLRETLHETRSVIDGLNRQLEATQEVLQLTSKERDEWRVSAQEAREDAQLKNDEAHSMKTENQRLKLELDDRSRGESDAKQALDILRQTTNEQHMALGQELGALEAQSKAQMRDHEIARVNFETRTRVAYEEKVRSLENQMRTLELQHADTLRVEAEKANSAAAARERELRQAHLEQLSKEATAAATKLAQRESDLEAHWRDEVAQVQMMLDRTRTDLLDMESNARRWETEASEQKTTVEQLKNELSRAATREGQLQSEAASLKEALARQEAQAQREYSEMLATYEQRLKTQHSEHIKEMDHYRSIEGAARRQVEQECQMSLSSARLQHEAQISDLEREFASKLSQRELEAEEVKQQEVKQLRTQLAAKEAEFHATAAMERNSRLQFEESIHARTEQAIKEMQISTEDEVKKLQERYEDEKHGLISRLGRVEADAAEATRSLTDRESNLRSDLQSTITSQAKALREVAYLKDQLAMTNANNHSLMAENTSLRHENIRAHSPIRARSPVETVMTSPVILRSDMDHLRSPRVLPYTPSTYSPSRDPLLEPRTVTSTGSPVVPSTGSPSVIGGSQSLIEGARSVRQALEEKSARLRAVLEAANVNVNH